MFEARIKNLHNLTIREKLDGYLVSASSNIFYLTGIDNFSREEREAYIFVTKRAAFLFTDDRYIHGIKNLPANIRLINIREMFATLKKLKLKSLGFEQNLTYFEFRRFKKETGFKLKLSKLLVENLRQIKDKNEIALLRSATTLTDITFEYIKKYIKIGVTEIEIASKIEDFIKSRGATLSFDSIVAFGENSAIPHHKTSDKKLTKKDQFVLLDFGVKSKNYCSDMTRTLLTKSASDKAKLVYRTVWQAQNTAAERIDPDSIGVEAGERRMNKIAEAANNVMRENKFPNIPHGLGHGIGIDVHEAPHLSPKSKDQIADGMTFTIEPGIYIPGFGGVRIEDDFYLNNGKLNQLTKSSKEMIVI